MPQRDPRLITMLLVPWTLSKVRSVNRSAKRRWLPSVSFDSSHQLVQGAQSSERSTFPPSSQPQATC